MSVGNHIKHLDESPDRFRALWKIGHDTASIAQICRVDESVVYNGLYTLESGTVPPRRVSPRGKRVLIPYAGKP